MNNTITSNRTIRDWSALVDDLNRFPRPRTTPIDMKLYESVAAMEAVPRIRRPCAVHTTDQIVGQARRNGWTVGTTANDPVGHGRELRVVKLALGACRA